MSETKLEPTSTERQPSVCFVIGRPRSGTTVFKHMLATHPNIINLGEIFNENHPQSYWEFLARRAKDDGTCLFPSKSTAMFLAYVDELKSRFVKNGSDRNFIVLDVKYDQAHSVFAPWQDMNALPRLFALMKQFGWYVIDIERSDVLAMSISNMIAMKRKVYHVEANRARDEDDVKISVDTKLLQRDIESTVISYSRLHRFFSGYPKYSRVAYENMFDESGEMFSPELIAQLARFLELPDRFNRAPKLRKVLASDPFVHILNVDEVRRAVAEIKVGNELLRLEEV